MPKGGLDTGCSLVFTSHSDLSSPTRRNNDDDCIGRELLLAHPHPLHSEYELHAGDELLARVSYTGILPHAEK
jgi:hypothetical protein